MTARQPPEEPTRPLPPARPIATEPTVVRTESEEALWAEVHNRLGSLRAWLIVVAMIALAALGVAAWVLLDNDADRGDASRVRVERLADRVDRLESQLDETASEGGLAVIRDRQAALQRRVQALRVTVEASRAATQESRATAQDVEETAAALEALRRSVDGLEQRVAAVEQQRP